jgi:glycosyltransferase involved in cell wall biosynthesis
MTLVSANAGAGVSEGSLPLSIFIIAKNEAARLPTTLMAVSGLANEIVVVDSGSADGTQDVARAFGAKVIETHWRGYGPQKRFAEEQCRNNWVLNLDCDEEATPELVAEIRRLFANGEPPLDGYGFPIAEILPGDSDPGHFAHVLTPIRLYRMDRGRYADLLVHDRVEMSPGAKTAILRGRVNHFSMETISQCIIKLNNYSDQQIDDMIARKRTVSSTRIWFEFPVAFFKAYILRRHILRGRFGFVAAVNYAFFRFMRVAKALERQDRAELK